MNFDHYCMNCFSNKEGQADCPTCHYRDSCDQDASIYLVPGTLLAGKYYIGKVLGRGGFGITYLGWDSNLDIKLAVKEYFPQGLVSRLPRHNKVIVSTDNNIRQFSFGLEKFLKEAKALAQFENNPCIVTVRDFFEANSTAYMIMSYIEGITFEDYLIDKGGKIPLKNTLDIMLPVMDALKEIHRAGFMHRDISPDNILIDINGRVIIIDFGAARQEVRERNKGLSVILKAGYAPEEQHRSRGKQGPWTDVYAVAATFYRALTGEKPPESIDRLAEDTLFPPSKLGIDINKREEEVLLKGLAVRSPDRYRSIDDFQQALIESVSVKPIIVKDNLKQCPYCDESVNSQSLKCDFCHSLLSRDANNKTDIKISENRGEFIRVDDKELNNNDVSANMNSIDDIPEPSVSAKKQKNNEIKKRKTAPQESKTGIYAFVACVFIAIIYLLTSDDSTRINHLLVIAAALVTLGLSILGLTGAKHNKGFPLAGLLFSAIIIAVAMFNLASSANIYAPADGKPNSGKEINVPSDYRTIQAAIDAASEGTVIIVAEGTYQESIDFKGKNIVLSSKDPDNLDVVNATIIDSNNKGTVVTFKSGENENALLSGFTITGGSGTRKQFTINSYDGTRLSFDRHYGGGILVTGGSEPTIIKNVIKDNNVKNISNDVLAVGGGIAILDNSNPRIEENIIINNFSEAYGGGLALWHKASPQISNNIIKNNRSGDIAGGVLIAMMCSPEIKGNIIEENHSANWSGGIYVAHMSTANITDNLIQKNTAKDGGGIFVRRAESIIINNNEIRENRATGNGGALYIDNKADAVLNNNLIFHNTAQNGGGVWVDNDSKLRLSTPDSNQYAGNKPQNIFKRK